MRHYLIKKAEKGMTLVEVLAALVILGIVFVGFMTIFPQMTLFNEKTGNKLETMNLAKQELATITQVSDLINKENLESHLKDVTVQSGEKAERFIYRKGKYTYEVDYYIQDELTKEEAVIIENTLHDSLHKIHIKIKLVDKLSSETYGYLVENKEN